MTACLFNNSNGSFANVVDGYVYPQFLFNPLRAPTTQDIYPAGTRWLYNSVNPPVIYETTGAGLWYSTAGGSSLSSLTVVGPTSLTGTTNINTTGSAATSIGTGGTGIVNIGNASSGTAVTGPLDVTGNLVVFGDETITGTVSLNTGGADPIFLGTGGTGPISIGNATGNVAVTGNETFAAATQGIVLTPATATGASPQTANGRSFAVTFSGVSIAAAAVQAFTISNSVITGAATQIIYTHAGATTGAALTIQSIVNSASQSIVTITNGTGAATTTANITLIGLILN